MKWEIIVLLTAIMLPPVSIAAPSDQMERILVTGSYTPQQHSDLTASVSVLDHYALRALNKRSIADLLKNVPGLSVEEQGGAGGLSAASIRGGEANFTLILLDGVPVNDPTNSRGGGFDFANLDPASVERIEIVRGPQSAVYGSDALSGVINIITNQVRQGHQQQIRAEGGEEGIRTLNMAASGATERWRYAVNMGRRDDGEQVTGSTRETNNANLRLNLQGFTGHEITLAIRHLDGQRTSFPEQSGGPEFALNNALDESDYQDQTFFLGLQSDLSDNWRSTLNVSRFQHDESFNSPGITPFFAVPPNTADTDFQRNQLQWVNSLQIAESLQLNLGVDYRDEQGESNGALDFGFFQLPTRFKLDRSTTSVFMDIHSRPLQPLLLQASVRYDDPDDFDGETSIKVGASYRLNTFLTLSANWGEAFKLPSFFALGHSLVGNPNLKPETVRSWDAGLKWLPTEELELAATYFSNDFQDLIDFDPALFINVNRSQVESRGMELQFSWRPAEVLRVHAQTTHTDMDVKDSSSVLMNRPEWKAGTGAIWQINSNWSTALDYQWTGEQFASSLHTGTAVVQTLDDYHRVDWNLRYKLGEYIHMEMALDNLFDEDYQTAVGFHGPDRTFRLSITFENSNK